MGNVATLCLETHTYLEEVSQPQIGKVPPEMATALNRTAGGKMRRLSFDHYLGMLAS